MKGIILTAGHGSLLQPIISIKELGWKPEVTFEEGLIRTLNWYRSKPIGRM